MDYYDEWRTILTDEEELDLVYADWESWYDAEFEHLTIAICLECGNALTRWSKFNYHFNAESEAATVLFCEVCR